MNFETPMDDATVAPEPPSSASPSLPFLAVSLFVLLWLGGSGLLIGAWIHPLVPGGWWTVLALLGVVLLPLRTLLRGFRGRSYPSAMTRLWVLRPFWFAMGAFPLLAVSTAVAGLVGWPWGLAGSAGRWGLAAGASVLVVMTAAGYRGARQLVVRRLEASLPRLPSAFDGLRVVQISDLHIGPHTSRGFLARMVAEIERADPDLVVFTGDQVDDFARDVELFNQTFRRLQPPLGRIAVAGNHDVYAGWDKVHRGLEAGGCRVLVNQAMALERHGQRLWIAGTGDPAGRAWRRDGGAAATPDVVATLDAVPPGEATLALAHNPALWPALAGRGVDLTLSGHTHYGQFALPRLGWCAASPFLDLAMGAHRSDRSLLYIHPGSNYWGIPVRIGTPPEVTLLTLRRGAPALREVGRSRCGGAPPLVDPAEAEEES
ncbi:MAG: metallophosphoesterase [Acidobacteriota bacterium]